MLISTSSTFVFVALAFGVTSTFGAPIPSSLLEAREILTGVTARSTQPAARVLSPQEIQRRESEPQTIGRRFPQPFSADDLKSRDLFARRSRGLKSRLEKPQSRTPDDEVDPRATVIVITDDDKGGQGTGKGTQRKGKGKGCKCSKKKKRPCKGGKGGRPGLGSPLSPGSTGLPESSPPMPVPDGSPNMPHTTIPTTEKQDKSPSDSTTAPAPGPGINGGEGHSSNNSTTTSTAESGQPTPPVDAGERKRRLFARLKETRSTGARSLRSLHNRSPS